MLAAPYSNKDSAQDPDVNTSPSLAFDRLEDSLHRFEPNIHQEQFILCAHERDSKEHKGV